MYQFFNTDGPTKIDEETFDSYKSLFTDQHPTLKALIDIWLDEHNPDPLRILCIRDAIRQTHRLTFASQYAYYCTEEQLNSLCAILESQNGKVPGLSYRPKLLREIVDELVYALAKGHITNQQHYQNDINRLIGILIKSGDEETGRTILPYHSIWNFYHLRTDYISPILDGIIDQDNPAWLRDKLWKKLQAHLAREAKTCQKAIESATEPLYSIQDVRNHVTPVPILIATADFINLYSIDSHKKNFQPLMPIINFLESELPSQLAYNPDHVAIVIAPFLPDTATTFLYARRHFLNSKEKILNYQTPRWLRFLYWLRGLTTSSHPDDTELLAEIDRCIAEIQLKS